jgi:hypothetical protein
VNAEIVHVSTGGMKNSNKAMLISYVKANDIIEKCHCLCATGEVSLFPSLPCKSPSNLPKYVFFLHVCDN